MPKRQVYFALIALTLLSFAFVPTALAAPVSGTINLSPASLIFGNQAWNTTSTAQAVTLTNVGLFPLTIRSTDTSGDFTATTNCRVVLQTRALCKIFVTFTPTASGARTGALTITYKSAGRPQNLAVNVVLAGKSATALPAVQLSLSTTAGTAPLAVNASTMSSSSPDQAGAITSTSIDFGDGTVVSTASANHTYVFPGTYTVKATVTNTVGLTGVATATLTVSAPVLTITTPGLPNGVIGSPYDASVSASGGKPPYIWSISSGSLPSTLALAATTGNISGTPSTAGTFTPTLQVIDSAANRVKQSYSIVISGPVDAVLLSWNASESKTVTGYNVYRSLVSGTNYTRINSSPIAELGYTDQAIVNGQTYYYVVTAVDAVEDESSHSDEIQMMTGDGSATTNSFAVMRSVHADQTVAARQTRYYELTSTDPTGTESVNSEDLQMNAPQSIGE
jgi:PKD repeat protein